MTHPTEHNPGDHEDPVAGPTWMVSIVGIVLLIVIFLGLTALYYNIADTEAAIRILDRQPAEFEALQGAQTALLQEAPHWDERALEGAEHGETEQHLVIPIDRAMHLVVDENSKPGR